MRMHATDDGSGLEGYRSHMLCVKSVGSYQGLYSLTHVSVLRHTRGPVPIQQAGWYYLQHVFYAKPCVTPALSGQQCVYADIKIFEATKGGACGAVYTHSPTTRTASWTLGSDLEEQISLLGSPR